MSLGCHFDAYLNQNGTKRGRRPKAAALFWKRPKAAPTLVQIMTKLASEGTILFDFGIFWRLFLNFLRARFQHFPEMSKKGSKTIKIPTSGDFSKSLSVADRGNVIRRHLQRSSVTDLLDRPPSLKDPACRHQI